MSVKRAVGRKNFKTMKLTKFIIVALMCGTATVASAQLTKEQLKVRKEIKEQSRKELQEKATKEARNEAKKLKKAGWLVSPGALPLEKQLDRSYLMQQEFDENLFPKYLQAEGQSLGENYDGAKLQAMELAKQNLAGQIQTEVTALIENSVANNQLSAGEAATVTKSIMSGKSLISQSLGRVIPVVEVYRIDKKSGNKEVLVRLAYNSEMAKAAAKKAARESLEKESDELQNKLDTILGW